MPSSTSFTSPRTPTGTSLRPEGASNPPMPSIHTVMMTAPDTASGESLATALVRDRLVACANFIPGVSSIYRWEGKIEAADEVLVIFKTSGERVDELLERAAELHPYDVPELIVLPVSAGNPAYFDWVRSETAARDEVEGEVENG